MIQDVWVSPDDILAEFGEHASVDKKTVTIKGTGFKMCMRIYKGTEHPLTKAEMCIINMKYRDVLNVKELKNRLQKDGLIQ